MSGWSGLRFGFPAMAIAAVLSLAAMQAPASADIIYDSNGFEGMSVGNLNGQDGWLGLAFLSQPRVVELESGNNAVALFGADRLGVTSVMTRGFGGNLATQFDVIEVSFDVFRTSEGSAELLLWSWLGIGDATTGGQAEIGGDDITVPLIDGWDSDSAPTEFDEFVNVRMQWDFVNGVAMGWYGGDLVSTLMMDDTPHMQFYSLALISGGDGFGGGSDRVLGCCVPCDPEWDLALIDNFTVTGDMLPVPEPVTLLLLATSGAVGLVARVRGRRSKRE